MNRWGRITLVIGLVIVVLMAFRVSWNALRDVARSIGADPTAALLYPIVVDGLMALALVATLALTGADRKFALRVLATYTIASLLLNYVHGLVPALHSATVDWGRLAQWDPANWALVLLATSLPVGSIYFGSDLVAKVLHHKPEPATATATDTQTRSSEANASEAQEASARNGETVETDESADQPVTAPAPTLSDTPRTEATHSTPRKSATPRTDETAPRKQTPGAGRNARPKKDDETVLEELAVMRLAATEPLAIRTVCQEIGIGQRRLEALLEREDLTLDPIEQAPADPYDGVELEPVDGLDEETDDPRHGMHAVPDMEAVR